MAVPLSPDHIHSFRRMKGERRYRCLHPDCNYIGTKEMIRGVRALCPYCHETYIVEGRLLELSKMHCAKCTRSSKQAILNKQQAVLDDVLGEVL